MKTATLLKQFNFSVKFNPDYGYSNQFEIQKLVLPVLSRKFFTSKLKLTPLIIERVIRPQVDVWALKLKGKFDIDIDVHSADFNTIESTFSLRNCSLIKSVITDFDRMQSETMYERLTIKVGSMHIVKSGI